MSGVGYEIGERLRRRMDACIPAVGELAALCQPLYRTGGTISVSQVLCRSWHCRQKAVNIEGFADHRYARLLHELHQY